MTTATKKYPNAAFMPSEIASGYADRTIEIHKRLYRFCEENHLLFNPPLPSNVIFIDNAKSADIVKRLMELKIYRDVVISWDRHTEVIMIKDPALKKLT